MSARSQLVAAPDTPQRLTLRRECDARTALARGLADYLETLAITLQGAGREVRLKRVYSTWAEPEDTAEYPAAAVYALDAGTYDESRLTPSTSQVDEAPRGVYLRSSCEFVQQLLVDVWATSPGERVALVAMLEDGFEPVDWMYGVRLELPHYHGARADFSPDSVAYLDNDDDAKKRYRKATLLVTARVPKIRVVGRLPDLQPRVDLREVTDERNTDPQSIGYDPRLVGGR